MSSSNVYGVHILPGDSDSEISMYGSVNENTYSVPANNADMYALASNNDIAGRVNQAYGQNDIYLQPVSVINAQPPVPPRRRIAGRASGQQPPQNGRVTNQNVRLNRTPRRNANQAHPPAPPRR